MNFSGAGVIPAGEYDEEIKISGSGHIKGNIKCTEFHSAGMVKGDGDIDCSDSIKISGSLTTKGNVKSGDKITLAGSATVFGRIKCEELSTAGTLYTDAGIEAETATIRGMINCGGLLNAEKIDVKINENSHAGSVGGGEITIAREHGSAANYNVNVFLPLKRLFRNQSSNISVGRGTFTVDEYIEGDTIEIEYVSSPVVTGRIVSIGAGCNIGTVRYSEQCEISPDAKVGSTEKI